MRAPDEALRGFIVTETGRAIAASPYPQPFMETATALLEAVEALLPERAATEAYGPSPDELRGKLVWGQGPDGLPLVGILHRSDSTWLIYDRPVEPPTITPLTREDMVRAREILHQDPTLF